MSDYDDAQRAKPGRDRFTPKIFESRDGKPFSYGTYDLERACWPVHMSGWPHPLQQGTDQIIAVRQAEQLNQADRDGKLDL